jgi:hypothetical protein
MKWFLRVFGALLILVGIVWILQGVNVLLGSAMSGHIQYSFLGILVGAVGAGLIFFSTRRPKTN